MLKAANKTLLEHNLGALEGTASEAIIVVGYKKNMIMDFLGNEHKGMKIRYVEQKEQLGTAHALSMAKKYIKCPFIFMFGDDIYSRDDIKAVSKERFSLLVSKVKNPENFGVVIEENGIVKKIVEKPKKFVSDLAVCGLYSFDKEIFSYVKKIKKSERHEFELPDAIRLLIKKEKMTCIPARRWLPIGYPWNLLIADKILRKGKNNIAKNSKISGTVKNSSVGSGCIIRGRVINSIIMDDSVVDKDSIVENSIIGQNSYFSGSAKSGKKAFSVVKGKKIQAGKFRTVIGDNTIAHKVKIKPGCRIWPNRRLTGEVTEDVI